MMFLRVSRRAAVLCRLCRALWTTSSHWSSEISLAHDGTLRDGNATAAIVLFTSSTWSTGTQEMMSGDGQCAVSGWKVEEDTLTCIHGDGSTAPLRRCRLGVVFFLITVWRWGFRKVEPHHLEVTLLLRTCSYDPARLQRNRTHLYPALHVLQLPPVVAILPWLLVQRLVKISST